MEHGQYKATTKPDTLSQEKTPRQSDESQVDPGAAATRPVPLEDEMTNLEKAAECEQRAAESFERCDTDGFLSQWADGIMARKYRLQDEIDANGGLAEFPVLFDLSGNEVPAKLISGKFGLCWAIMAADGETFSGKFISAFPKREATMTAKGFREGKAMRPAIAAIVGSGKGLSGAANCTVIAVEKKK